MYTKEVRLKHSEKLLAVDQSTGEARHISLSKRGNPNIERFDHGTFIKHYPYAWGLLSRMTSNIEYAVAVKMSCRIGYLTNTLEPLSDETTYKELSKEFGVSINRIKAVLDKLFDLGVYGKFLVSEWKHEEFGHKQYWVFNPFLSSNGAGIDKRSKSLFINTFFAYGAQQDKD